MPSPLWELAIDVGGTFTDCLAYGPNGEQLRHKLLSSGITKGTVGSHSTSSCIVDPARVDDPANFWVSFKVFLLDEMGQRIAETTVIEFDAPTGTLRLDNNLNSKLQPGTAYELACDLEAPVIGIRYLLGLPLATPVPPIRLRLGTTRGTNALLTRSGAPTALVTTRGFGDLLDIGYQDRPRLFDLTIRKPEPLIATSIEVNERLSAEGEILIPLDPAEVRDQLQQLRQQGIKSLAICLLHADLFPNHEEQIAAIASKVGFAEISRSSEVAPLVKIVPRAETTVVDGYLNPVLRQYLTRLEESLPGSQIRLMTSAGGLVAPADFRGPESVLSGPAGGVVGYAQVAKAAGFERAIGFDMGGTSTDVSRYDGAFEFEYESRKAGARLIAPSLAIETVAAGGGSICQFDGAKLTVGPASAGADPGPACYGRGGPLTVTDVNFYLGRIAVERFPFSLQRPPVEANLDRLAREIESTTGEILSHLQIASGLLRIANANMARAVRSISVAKGVAPADYLLVGFGGAAAQHACAIAEELGIQRVLNHPQAGILSAYGIGKADVVRHAATGLSVTLTNINKHELSQVFDELIEEPAQQVIAAGCKREQIEVQQSLDLRYTGTDEPLHLPFESAEQLKSTFETHHMQLYGYLHDDRPIEIVAARVQVTGKTESAIEPSSSCDPRSATPTHQTTTWFDGNEKTTPVYDRDQLHPGTRLTGPAIVADEHSTIVLESSWNAEMLSGGELLLVRSSQESSAEQPAETASAVMLEVFNNLLSGIAEQMGHILRRTASSVNVKERLDYSCAIFTAEGELVANAPHVPVHLGAMGATVRAMIAERPHKRPGDVYVTNDPYRGGSHLPDITVITPVFHDERLVFFTACRAHHAEIGGIRPGSMPPASKNLAEEGVLISNFALVDQGELREDALRKLLAAGPYPSRRVDENLADLRAQVAANRQGAAGLVSLVKRFTLPKIQTQLGAVQDAAESKVRLALAKLALKECKFTDYLETHQGEAVPICVKLTFCDDPSQAAVTIDFAGTAPVVAGNLNANRAIVTAAVMYVLRLLVDEDIPLNEGALRAVDIRLPHCLLNPKAGETPETTPAVAAGNVETSQRVVDVLLGALGIAAASQGTMNNLLFGDDSFGYYETICGGSGATASGSGADAVQVHMTNTRSTDPEVFERWLPIRLWEFSIRRGSGGAGKHQGGNGVVRKLEFLRPLEVSLITSRRGRHAPYGAAGGDDGQPGRNELTRHNGKTERLPGICEFEVKSGDILTIQTPGGGGYEPRDE